MLKYTIFMNYDSGKLPKSRTKKEIDIPLLVIVCDAEIVFLTS